MKNKLLRAVFLLVGLIGLPSVMVLAQATPASAYVNCPSGQLCIWNGTGETGTQWNFTYSGSGGRGSCVTLMYSVHPDSNNAWSSYYNGLGSGLTVTAWDGGFCSGTYTYTIYNDGHVHDFGAFNNIISSYMIN